MAYAALRSFLGCAVPGLLLIFNSTVITAPYGIQDLTSAATGQRLWEARALHATKIYDEAAARYAEASAGGGGLYDAVAGHVAALLDGGHYDRAEAALTAGCGTDVQQYPAPLARLSGRLLCRRGDAAAALDVFRSILRAVPDDAATFAGMALALLGMGSATRSQLYVRRAKVGTVSDPGALVFLGEAFMELGEWQTATDCFHQRVAQTPEDVYSRAQAARCLMRRGLTAEAESILGDILALFPREAPVVNAVRSVEEEFDHTFGFPHALTDAVDVRPEDLSVDFGTLSMDLDVPPHVADLLPEGPAGSRGCWGLRRIPISRLYAAILAADDSSVQMAPLTATPHYRLLVGDGEAAYLEYAATTAPQKSGEEWVRDYRALEASFEYLKRPNHAGEYITVIEGSNSEREAVYRILDGLHRAVLLQVRGVTSVLCAVMQSAYDPARTLRSFVREFRDDFLEWYQPLEFGTDADTIVHSRTFPDFLSMLDTDPSRGRAKWAHVIRDTIPDVRGKVVYDVGCNAGLFTMELARLGASKGVGIDRNEHIVQPTNVHLPKQNVVNQAQFVRRAFELADGRDYDNVEFMAEDIATYRFDKIEADVVCAFCVFYHLGEARYLEVLQQLSAAGVSHVVLQASHDHPPPLGDVSSLANARALLERAGFEIERVAAPEGFGSPIIVGRQ